MKSECPQTTLTYGPTAASHPGRRFSSAGYRIALCSLRYGRSARYTSRCTMSSQSSGAGLAPNTIWCRSGRKARSALPSAPSRAASACARSSTGSFPPIAHPRSSSPRAGRSASISSQSASMLSAATTWPDGSRNSHSHAAGHPLGLLPALEPQLAGLQLSRGLSTGGAGPPTAGSTARTATAAGSRAADRLRRSSARCHGVAYRLVTRIFLVTRVRSPGSRVGWPEVRTGLVRRSSRHARNLFPAVSRLAGRTPRPPPSDSPTFCMIQVVIVSWPDLPQHRVARPAAHVEPVHGRELAVPLLGQPVPLHRDRRRHQVPLPRSDRRGLEVHQHHLAEVGQQVPGVRVPVNRPGRQSELQVLVLLGQLSAALPQELPVLARSRPRGLSSRSSGGLNASNAGRSHGQPASEWKLASSRARSACVGVGSPPVTARQNDTGWPSTNSGWSISSRDSDRRALLRRPATGRCTVPCCTRPSRSADRAIRTTTGASASR